MNLQTEPYLEQQRRWPASGRHILAQFDASTVVVYQAYRPAIGQYAAQYQCFGGEFSFSRMSWIKPNFLWMMYRCGWGTKPNQEVVLAVHLKREGFDETLSQAVHSTYIAAVYGSPEAWKARVAESAVRLQWDPDHDPSGVKQERRAIQLGLSGEVLRRYAKEWTVKIEDISDFVAEQRQHVQAASLFQLVTPREDVYPVTNKEVAARLGVSPK